MLNGEFPFNVCHKQLTKLAKCGGIYNRKHEAAKKITGTFIEMDSESSKYE